MSKVYDNVSQYIDSLEQNPNLEYLEKEMIKYALKKVSKSLTLGSIRQPVDDVVIESYALTDSSSQKWIMPCEGTITDTFRIRDVHPVTGKKNVPHNGIDIAVPIKTPIKAIADGTVCAVGPARGYGFWVAINHGVINGKIVTSEYGHILSWNVHYGQKVKKGQPIALSGNTGDSDGPHCHLTIREGKFQGKPVNPFKYIKK